MKNAWTERLDELMEENKGLVAEVKELERKLTALLRGLKALIDMQEASNGLRYSGVGSTDGLSGPRIITKLKFDVLTPIGAGQ